LKKEKKIQPSETNKTQLIGTLFNDAFSTAEDIAWNEIK
jgi:hypothetical protein